MKVTSMPTGKRHWTKDIPCQIPWRFGFLCSNGAHLRVYPVTCNAIPDSQIIHLTIIVHLLTGEIQDTGRFLGNN
jgi:hypothetical protein